MAEIPRANRDSYDLTELRRMLDQAKKVRDREPEPPTSAQPPSASSIMASSAPVALGTLLSRITGLLRTAILAGVLGRSALAGTYGLANTLPNLLYELVLGGVLSATLVPMFTSARIRQDRETESVLISTSLAVLMWLGVAGVAVAWLGSWLLTDPSRPASGTVFAAIAVLVMPQVVFYGFTSIATAVLNAHGQYRTAAFAPILTNVCNIAAFLAAGAVINGNNDILGVEIMDLRVVMLLGLGTTVGIAAMALVLVKPVRAVLPSLRWTPHPRHWAIREMLGMSKWTVGYVVANQITVVVLSLLLYGDKAAYVAYTSAFIFFQLPHGLLAVSIMTTTSTPMAEAVEHRDPAAFMHTYFTGLRTLLTAMIPAAVALFVLSVPLVAALLEHGQFDRSDTIAVAQTLRAFALGLPWFSTFLYTMRAFYARKDTYRPFVLNLVDNLVTIAGAVLVVLVVSFTNQSDAQGAPSVSQNGSAWFALVYSLGYTVAAALAFITLGRQLGDFPAEELRSTRRVAARMGLASAPMLIIGIPVMVSPAPGKLAALAICLGVTGLGGVLTLAFGRALHVEEATQFLALLRRITRRQISA